MAQFSMTKNQKLVFDFIVKFKFEHADLSPSMREIADGCQMKSICGAHRACGALKERGIIDFIPRRARSIRIVGEDEHVERHGVENIVQHVQRGSYYNVIGTGEVQCSRPIIEGDILYAYQDKTGKIWYRPKGEFEDGRFRKITTDKEKAA